MAPTVSSNSDAIVRGHAYLIAKVWQHLRIPHLFNRMLRRVLEGNEKRNTREMHFFNMFKRATPEVFIIILMEEEYFDGLRTKYAQRFLWVNY